MNKIKLIRKAIDKPLVVVNVLFGILYEIVFLMSKIR